VKVPRCQPSGTYTTTLQIRATGGGTSNVVTVTLQVIVTDTLKQLEASGSPGTPVGTITLPDVVYGNTTTTSGTYVGVIYGSPVAWTLQATMAATTLSDGAGHTIATTNCYVETAPTTGTYTAMSTTYRTVQTGLAAATTSSGAFHLQVKVPAGQATGQYTGTLDIRVSGAGTSNVVAVNFVVNVVETLKQIETAAAPGTAITAYSLPEGNAGTTQTSTDTFRFVLNGTYAAWAAQAATSATTFTDAADSQTIPATAIQVENAPTLNSYFAPSTTYTSLQSAIPAATLTSGYFHLRVVIPAGTLSGAYTGTLDFRVSNGFTISVVPVTLTVQVTASIVFNCISTVANCTTPVTSISFPETPPGSTSAAQGPYIVNLTSTSSYWSITASITSAFTKASTGETLPGNDIQVQGVAQGATWAGLGSAVTVQSSIINTTHSSGNISFRFAPPAGADSGNYNGVVTVTASTL
jgi:hypothetical protein